jgi:hypothetical protein
MNEEEYKELVKKLGKEIADKIKAAADELEGNLLTKYKKVFEGGATAEEVKAMKDEVMAANKKLEETLIDKLKAQGETIGELKAKLTSTPQDAYADLEKQVSDKREALRGNFKSGHGAQTFELKAAGITATIGIGGNAASIQEQGAAAALLRLGDGEVHTIQRGRPFILDFVTVGNTTLSAITWFDEIAKQGAFAITAEGALKPLNQYIFERRTSSYKKAAGYIVITEEFDMDFPRLVSTIKNLAAVDVRNDMNAQILTDMIAGASAYAYNGLDDLVDNADYYGAIGAAIAQLQSLYYTPNVLVLNPADAWAMRLTKGTDGHYIMPPFTWNNNTYEFGQVIVDPRVAVGNFFVGDGSVFHVELRGDVIIKMGWVNDDFIKNQYTLVVEQYFFDYISTARKAGFIYANFATVMADIEKP